MKTSRIPYENAWRTGVRNLLGVCIPLPVAYPGWHTPGVQTEDRVLAPLGKLKNGAPRRRCWMGEGGSMLEVIISFQIML